MSITATELKMNLSKYLTLASTEDIYITKNGKIVAKLTNPNQSRIDIVKSTEYFTLSMVGYIVISLLPSSLCVSSTDCG